MADFLDQYGVADERRAKFIKRLVISLVSIAVVGGALFFIFHNFREEQKVKQFYALLVGKDYKAAYAMFGCTDTTPCPGYEFSRFLEDWGPASGHNDLSNVRISRSRSCGSGVLLTIEFGGNHREKLWVERRDRSIGFPPVQGCPAM